MTVRLRDLLLGLRDLHLAGCAGDRPFIVKIVRAGGRRCRDGGQRAGGGIQHSDRPDVYLQDDDHPADRTGK